MAVIELFFSFCKYMWMPKPPQSIAHLEHYANLFPSKSASDPITLDLFLISHL